MDISNKTLAVLLIAAIVVSLGGTLLSTGGQKTGAVTTGTVDYSIANSYIVSFSAATIDFGSGSVTPGTTCTLSTDAAPAGGCVSFTTTVQAPLKIENLGNADCKLEVEYNNTATGLIGSSSSIQHAVTDIDQCTGEFSYVAIPTTANTRTTLCSNFVSTTNINNFVELELKFGIHSDDTASGDNPQLTATIVASALA